jgi:glyceraldehyde-3-phosphate dehydrogenase/erythrose-4-phosphate dehydrogenase
MAAGNLVKVLGWYDNEMGYSSRLVDLSRIVGTRRTKKPKAPKQGPKRARR